jgi:integrase
MKTRDPHKVPLSPRSIEILQDLKECPRKSDYVFQSIRSAKRCMSENTLNAALRVLGYESTAVSAHGFHTSASTILNASKKWDRDAIERQLAHKEKDPIKRIYDRGQH